MYFGSLYCINLIIFTYFKFILHHLFFIHFIPKFYAAVAFVVLFDPEDEDIYYFEMSVTI